MPVYEVGVYEIWSATFGVEAESEEQAKLIARGLCGTNQDLFDREFEGYSSMSHCNRIRDEE
jgi:hypothetical protein